MVSRSHRKEPPPRFDEWQHFLFGRFAEFDALDPRYQHVEFACPDEEFMDLFEHTMRQAKALAAYSDDQVGRGLQYLFNNSFSNIVYRIQKTSAPVERHAEAIAAMRYLYSDCFETRCAPAIVPSTGDRVRTELDHICYMLWDVSPLLQLAGKRPPGTALYGVLEGALACKNPACIESALHGLGHLHTERSAAIVSRFLESRKYLHPELVRYAHAARDGCIQ
jgi:hypothetical protein